MLPTSSPVALAEREGTLHVHPDSAIRAVPLRDPRASSAHARPGALFRSQQWQILFAFLIVIVDGLALFAGYKLSGPTGISDYHLARQVVSVWYVVTYIVAVGVAGLYRRPYTAGWRSQFRRCLKGHMAVIFCLSVPLLFLFGTVRTVQLAAALTVVFVPALLVARVATLLLRRILRTNNWFLDRAVIILDEREGPKIPFWVIHLRRVGYDVAHVFRCTSIAELNVKDLAARIEETGARCIIIPSARYVSHAFEPIILFARQKGLTIRLFSPEVQRVLCAAKVDDAAGITIEAPVRQRVTAMQQTLKRAFDVSAASVLLLISAPLAALVMLAIKLEDNGPLLFRQPRSSSPGKHEFLVFKFRSMTVDSTAQRQELATANEGSGLFKIRNDPRVTRVGRMIRRSSIDELPQLLNVLRGEMSLVGPRPLPSDDFSLVVGTEMDNCYHRRAWVKPGLTGLWQISGRSELGFGEMVMLDLYYAEHGTAFLDMWILLNTLPVVLFGRGAY
jgi:exopolysaccharide biosynthesis polyprenyl glycosylphosphotransferase